MIKFQKLPLIFLLCFLFINISFAKEIFTPDFERKAETNTKKISDNFFCIKSSKKYKKNYLKFSLYFLEDFIQKKLSEIFFV